MSACCSWSAKSATAWARHVANDYAAKGYQRRFLVNGEPTENHIALASKGTLRVEVTATGRMAHSAYPELGESAIDKLIPALTRLRAMPLPTDRRVGPCTLNIGLIEGGRAPNVIPDYAHADLLYRLVGSVRRFAATDYRRPRAIKWRSRFRWNFPSFACARSTDCRR